jgi:hypothetical protein
LLRNCRQLSADHWQGTRPDGALFDIRGGAMPPKQRLLVFNNDERLVGLIRLIPAIKRCDFNFGSVIGSARFNELYSATTLS